MNEPTRIAEESQAHTAMLEYSKEDAVAMDKGCSEDEITEETGSREPYPRRQRRRPQTLTYDKLGQPNFTERTVSTKEIAVRVTGGPGDEL